MRDPAGRSAAEVAAEAAAGFMLFECDKCAAAIVDALKKKGLSGKVLVVQALDAGGRPSLHNIFSDEFRGIVSENGFHRAVEAGDLVFDNLHPSGIPFRQWFEDLHAPFGLALEEEPF